MAHAVYDQIAGQYKDSKQLDFRKYIEAYTLLKLAGEVKGKEILDLACGEGIYTRMIKSLGAGGITGVDISSEMIRLAEQEETRDPKGCKYVVHDAITFEMPGRFDLVMGMYLLNYARTADELLAMCRAAFHSLKDNGRFIGFNDNPANKPGNYGTYGKYGFIKETTATRQEGDFIRYVISNPDGTTFGFDNYYLSPETYERCFAEAGFKAFRWEGPYLDPHMQDNPHWDVFFNDPPLIGFSATK